MGYGGCIATDMITVKGLKVGYMYRDRPNNPQDSGRCFTAGTESQEYMDDASNHGIYDVNTIANYDPEIIPFLDEPVGSAFERDKNGKFVPSIPFIGWKCPDFRRVRAQFEVLRFLRALWRHLLPGPLVDRAAH